jgi:hypothetical protein
MVLANKDGLNTLTLFDERRPQMVRDALADSNAYSTHEIRQIQMLMVLFSCLSPDSNLREVFEHALALPHEPWLSRVTPVSDTSFDGLKPWLEALWVREGLTDDEQFLLHWQKSGKNIEAAVQELKAIEERTGFGLSVTALQPVKAMKTDHRTV